MLFFVTKENNCLLLSILIFKSFMKKLYFCMPQLVCRIMQKM
jgi:hypothetical protein